jgi:hypothetical protein
MSDANLPQDPLAGISPEEMTSALFANLVLQQANMALMFLGKVAHPQSGKTVTDLEAARMFIDQMEMIETKTKGNLTAPESAVLKQSLTSVRLAFVEVVERGEQPAPPASPPGAADTAAAAQGQPPAAPSGATEASESEADARKKFTKKY